MIKIILFFSIIFHLNTIAAQVTIYSLEGKGFDFEENEIIELKKLIPSFDYSGFPKDNTVNALFLNAMKLVLDLDKFIDFLMKCTPDELKILQNNASCANAVTMKSAIEDFKDCKVSPFNQKSIDESYETLLIIDVPICDSTLNCIWKNILSRNIVKAIKDASLKNIPIILFTFKTSTIETSLSNAVKPLQEQGYSYRHFIKDDFDAFTIEELSPCLKAFAPNKTIFIVGASTNLCIASTIESGIEKGFHFIGNDKFFDSGCPKFDFDKEKFKKFDDTNSK